MGADSALLRQKHRKQCDDPNIPSLPHNSIQCINVSCLSVIWVLRQKYRKQSTHKSKYQYRDHLSPAQLQSQYFVSQTFVPRDRYRRQTRKRLNKGKTKKNPN